MPSPPAFLPLAGRAKHSVRGVFSGNARTASLLASVLQMLAQNSAARERVGFVLAAGAVRVLLVTSFIAAQRAPASACLAEPYRRLQQWVC